MDTDSRRALAELIEVLREADERWVSPEWNLHTTDDAVDAHRTLMHYLQWGLVGLFERDPSAPRFGRIVAPHRKILGDNPDAIYFDAPISADHAYRVRGETKGAAYVSITIESGAAWGSMDNQVVGVINDTSFDIDAAGRFEILLGGEPRERNWLALPPGAGSISTRHYFEDSTHAAADPARVPAMAIEVIGRRCCRPGRPTPPSAPASNGSPLWCANSPWTVSQSPRASPAHGSRWCPTSSPPPTGTIDLGLAALDDAYAMAPFVVGPDASAGDPRAQSPGVATPTCACGTRHLKTLDDTARSISAHPDQDVRRSAVDRSHRSQQLSHRTPAPVTGSSPRADTFVHRLLEVHAPREGDMDTPEAQLVRPGRPGHGEL